MKQDDYHAFAKALDDAHSLKGVAPHTAENKALFFRLLADWDLRDVLLALKDLLLDPEAGQYRTPIVPAHLVGQLRKAQARDGRPEPDEAWPLVLTSFDEAETVVLTEEMLTARAVAAPLMAIGDKIAARKAFLTAYAKEVTKARQSGFKPKWLPSLGTDPVRRAPALESAHTAGLLPAPSVAGLLGKPESEPEYDAEIAAQNLAKLKQMVAGLPTLADRAQAASEAKRARQAQLLADHDRKYQQAARGGDDE